MEWETCYGNPLRSCPLKLKGELAQFRARQKGQKKTSSSVNTVKCRRMPAEIALSPKAHLKNYTTEEFRPTAFTPSLSPASRSAVPPAAKFPDHQLISPGFRASLFCTAR